MRVRPFTNLVLRYPLISFGLVLLAAGVGSLVTAEADDRLVSVEYADVLSEDAQDRYREEMAEKEAVEE